ncbi:MAG: hypothetical protein O7G85_05415 [Planctomycetota bacterium]|nr:hypothetical protein [Planctomycetota bacterium]
MNLRHNHFFTHECRSIGVPIRVSALLGLLLTFLITPSLHAQCFYEAVELRGPATCGGGLTANFRPRALDAQGNAVGASSCNLALFASLVRADGSASWLTPIPNTGESWAFGMLDPDHIVGHAVPSGQSLTIAAKWEFGQGSLLGLLPGSNTSSALGINQSGLIVGQSINNNIGPSEAFIVVDGQMTSLELPFGRNAIARDVNDLGHVTGWMGASPLTDSHVYIWNEKMVIDLGVIPGGTTAEGLAINNLSHIVGRGRVPDGVTVFGSPQAILWDGQVLNRLPQLQDHIESSALALNDADQIVGNSFVGGATPGRFATLWQDGQVYNLRDLLVTDLGDLRNSSGWAINNKGQILLDEGSAYLLTPIDSPPGDVDHNCKVDVEDLLILLGDWGKTLSIADVDANGIVDVLDLLQVLADWGLGGQS